MNEQRTRRCRCCHLTLIPDPELSSRGNTIWIHEDGHAILCRGPKEAHHEGHATHPGHHA